MNEVTDAVDPDNQLHQLRTELARQWMINHYEHCQSDWPHEGDCHWPVPSIVLFEEMPALLLEP